MAGPWEQYAASEGPWTNYSTANQPADDSRARGFLLGALKPIDNLAKAAEKGFNAITGGSGTSAADASNERDAMRQANTRTGAQLAGNIVGTLPTLALPGGAAVQGGVGGAVLSDAGSAQGVATDAVLGAVGGKVGDKIVETASKVIAPKVAPVARRLLDEGVKLTPGQIMGGAVKRVEDAVTSIPLVGDVVRGAQRRSLEGFNRAAVNRAVKPIGKAVPGDITGNEAVRWAGDQLDNAYNAILPRISATADKTLATRIMATRTRAQLAPAMQDRFDDVIRQDFGQAFKSGTMTGRAAKDLETKLTNYSSGWLRSANPDEKALGRAVSDLRDHLRALIRRQNPKEAPALAKINTGWANLVRVENAAKMSSDGVFTPGQLRTAVRTSDRSIRKRAVARGEALMQDLAADASERLPSSVPDSGTPTRLLATLGAAGGMGAISPTQVGLGALAAGAYTRPGQSALRFLLARQAGPGAQQAAAGVGLLRQPARVAVPALLTRPQD